MLKFIKKNKLYINYFLKQSSWSVIDNISNPAVQLILTPYYLSKLGVANYGLLALVLSFIGFAQFVSVGASISMIKLVSQSVGKKEHSKARAYVQSAVIIALVNGLVVFFIVCLSSNYLAENFFLKVGKKEVVSMMLRIGVILVLMQEIDNIYSGALKGVQRFDLSAKVEFLTRAMFLVIIFIVFFYNASVILVLQISMLILFFKIIIKNILINKIIVSNVGYSLFNFKLIREIFDFGKWQCVHGLGGVLFSIVDRMLIGAFFGASELGKYSICMQLSKSVHSLSSAATLTIFPWVSSLQERNRINIKQALKVSFFAGLICLFTPVVLYLMSEDILRIWVGGEFSIENHELLEVLIIAYGLLAFNIPVHYMMMGFGKIRFVSIMNLIAGCGVILSSYLLIKYGLFGFAYSKMLYGPIIFLSYLFFIKTNERIRNIEM